MDQLLKRPSPSGDGRLFACAGLPWRRPARSHGVLYHVLACLAARAGARPAGATDHVANMNDKALPDPSLADVDPAALDALHTFVERHPRLLVLTGAGISTDSGIPGYRDRNGQWMRSPPIQLHEFLGSDAARRRYWARSMIGWPVVGRAQPNGSHVALARNGDAGRI